MKGKGAKIVSQSLHFFRAFQVVMVRKVTLKKSQSLHFFRAFQGINESLLGGWFVGLVLSQSLHFFRAFQARGRVQCQCSTQVAIPSLFQGISSLENGYDIDSVKYSRNPFTFSGHFKDQAFWGTQSKQYSRNPFTFSGHFKKLKTDQG